ncbi:DUF4145 domain-containing protein [Phyllobacterium chamaecytisi]|uniref:DUF4145 domain-containing protein n=1 Tax=Phyllobacterium chamaecytisi TaxID=2876082 RepID=UPI001CCA23A6|nr:DUF4145 domain-containing protein [Phyllobacterium sp. KW56]MBZ9604003.1 DUF4145 domain-containing protein [Phyllobacterium sp. KW56]
MATDMAWKLTGGRELAKGTLPVAREGTMIAESMVGTTIKAHCSNCSGERNCEIRGHHKVRGSDDYAEWWTTWYLLVCCGCEHVFAQSVSGNSESYDYDCDEQGRETRTPVEAITTWPAKFKRNRPDWFVDHRTVVDIPSFGIYRSLSELYGALDNDLNTLAAIGVRTTFDIASEQLGVASGLSFEKKLQAMVDCKLITESQSDHLGVLIDAGSASAHRGWQPSVDDLDTLMDVLEEFLHDSFVAPAKKKVADAKVAKMKAKVPPRPGRKAPAKKLSQPAVVALLPMSKD